MVFILMRLTTALIIFSCLIATSRAADIAVKPAAFTHGEDMAFLRQMTKEVVQASRVQSGSSAGGSPTNSCGFTLIMPGGNGGYPAFWVRDFSMSLDPGFITQEETLNHLRLIARVQNGAVARPLKNKVLIPPFAIPDHINFDGKPVFYPGTYSSSDDQGDGSYGFLPPVDDHYEFVHIAHHLFREKNATGFLSESVNGLTILERLVAAFDAPETDAETGMVITDKAHRAVGFGFCDGIYFTGHLLFPSLLRHRAAGEFAEIFQKLGKPERAQYYQEIQKKIADHLLETFAEPKRIHGWLMAATEIGRQPDVWGTLYALHLGILKEPAASEALRTILAAVTNKTIAFEAAVRHVPVDMDFSATSAWERTVNVPLNNYQNGAYWHTATGWLIEAVQRADPKLASEWFAEYIRHLRKDDFRLGGGHGAPWECLHGVDYRRNNVYMTSVTLPYAVLSHMIWLTD